MHIVGGAATVGLKREVWDPGFVSTSDPVFGHVVHALRTFTPL
jgi:hypothetical protein